jgi:hypothetical protein
MMALGTYMHKELPFTDSSNDSFVRFANIMSEQETHIHIVEIDVVGPGFSPSQPCKQCNSALYTLDVMKVVHSTEEGNVRSFHYKKYKTAHKTTEKASVSIIPKLKKAVEHYPFYSHLNS